MEKSIGKATDRADARLKVTGAARFTAEIAAANTAYAVFVGSRIAKGKIARIDLQAAEKVGGVLAILTHENSMLSSRLTTPLV
jgi:xanthine dehydrogenase YagR molybdenum-binding subunit